MRMVRPSSGERGHVAVDLGLRAHVDAAGGLVEDQHARLHGQPLAQDDLLLVSAGQVHDAAVDRGRLDAEARDLGLRDRVSSRDRSRKPQRE